MNDIDDIEQAKMDILRLLPPPHAAQPSMLAADVQRLALEIRSMRHEAALLELFEKGLVVPRVVEDVVTWFAVEHDPLLRPPSEGTP